MTTVLSIDRFEGTRGEIAVLVDRDGHPLNLPRGLLPAASKAGDVVRLTIERDPKATAGLAAETKEIQADLARGDDGGEINL